MANNKKRLLVPDRDFTVRKIPFPNCAVDGAVVSNDDGTATIVINSRVCPDRQLKAFAHELRHLENDDLYSDVPVWRIEAGMRGV